jgi:zinc/manganese transport system substrate-binding protein
MTVKHLSALSILFLMTGGIAVNAVNIVATSPDLAWVAKEVAGKDGEVSAIARGDQDPHMVEPKPSFILKLKKADLMMEIGMEMEIGYLPPLLEQARNPKIQNGQPGFFDASEYITKIDIPTGKIDRSMGDVHPGGNPHYQLDPENLARIGLALAQRLGQLDAAHAADYKTRGDALAQRLRKLRAELVAQFAADKGRPVVVYHNAMKYLSNMFGLKEVAYLEPLPGIPPSPAHIVEVIGVMKQSGAKAILVENYFSRREADAVAEKTGGKVVVVPISVGGDAQSGDYEALMRHLATEIKAGLS